MMTFFSLASGSKGNASAFKINQQGFLIDIGLTYNLMQKKFMALKQDITLFNKLFLTHEHLDHIKGLISVLKQKLLQEIFLTKGTFRALLINAQFRKISHLLPKLIFIKANEPLFVKGLLVQPFAVSHDALEPVNFVFNYKNKKIVCLFDTGSIDPNYLPLLSNGDCYFVEANYSKQKLLASKRPLLIKKRILSTKGHLSNYFAVNLMNKIVDKTKKTLWIVSHMSEECNSQENFKQIFFKYFDKSNKIRIFFASQKNTPQFLIK